MSIAVDPSKVSAIRDPRRCKTGAVELFDETSSLVQEGEETYVSTLPEYKPILMTNQEWAMSTERNSLRSVRDVIIKMIVAANHVIVSGIPTRMASTRITVSTLF